MQSVEEYLDEIRPYLKDVINNLKKISPWKINFISSRDDYDEERVMHSKSDNIEIMISDEADEVMKKVFDSLKNRYKKIGLMRNSEFVFDYVKLLYYKCHKINRNRSGSYLDSPDSIKNKKTTINPINKKDNKCFQYVITVELNYKGIGKYAGRMIIKMHKVLKVNI